MKKKTVISGAISGLFLALAFNTTAYAGVAVPASIGDFVWNDLDGDGVQDAGEPGLAGIDVHLCGANSSMTIDCSSTTGINLFTTTDANGDYLFTASDYSNYYNYYFIVEIDPATLPGFIATTPTSKFFNSLGNSNPITTADFGFQAVPVPAAAWLFGSGLLGLLGMARRKRAV